MNFNHSEVNNLNNSRGNELIENSVIRRDRSVCRICGPPPHTDTVVIKDGAGFMDLILHLLQLPGVGC